MGMIVVVDINGQNSESSITLARLIEAAPVEKVILSGAAGPLDGWVRRLKSLGRTIDIEAIEPKGRKDESTIMLAARATAICLSDPDNKQKQWVIISRRDGFQGLCELLKHQGAHSALWLAALTHDAIRSILGSEESMSTSVREVAKAMLAKNGQQPVLIASLANTLTELIPELRKPKDREALFGARKFKAICLVVGLKVKGEHVYGIA